MLHAITENLLAITRLAHQQVYIATSQSRVQVKDMVYTNHTETTLQLSLLERLKDGYLMRVEISDFTQTATDALSEVLADLNSLNKVLDVRLDLHGNLISVLNRLQLLTTWKLLQPELEKKYTLKHPAYPLIQGMEAQLRDENTLCHSLKNKGLYGLLFPDLYGWEYSKRETLGAKTMQDYFGNIALPLLHTTHIEKEEIASLLLLRKGQLDKGKFDDGTFQQKIKQIMDAPNYPVQLSVTNEESYRVSILTGLLVGAEQYLKSEVKGAYLNESRHILKTKEFGA